MNAYKLQSLRLESYGLKSPLISRLVLGKKVHYVLNPKEDKRQYSSYHKIAESQREDDVEKEQMWTASFS